MNRCPRCGSKADVDDTHHAYDDRVTVRAKRCASEACGFRFNTHEFVLPAGPRVVEILLAAGAAALRKAD